MRAEKNRIRFYPELKALEREPMAKVSERRFERVEYSGN